jgi:hypothetical protein
MNYQTELKIKNIKEAIKNKENLKEIDKKYFNSSKKKEVFLNKNCNYFTSEELEYLNYSTTNKTEDVETVENRELEENNQPTNKLTNLESNFFKDTENLKALIEIVKRYRDNKDVEIIEAGVITIPAEAKLKLDRNMAVKVNGELYDKIVEMSYKNKVGKGELVTYILWEFYKKHN